MDKNKKTPISYTNEPQNYQKVRGTILSLMNDIKKAKEDVKVIASLDIVVEAFQERTELLSKQLSQAIYLLGEIYGYTLSDDILENVVEPY